MTLISELLHSRVVDATGRDLGSVDDVRLVQDGPLVEGFGSLLRVDGLVVGTGGLAVRLGYHRHQVGGPLLVRAIARRLEQRASFVSWNEVDSWDCETVRLRIGAGEVRRVAEVY
jgi:hypothetical protein